MCPTFSPSGSGERTLKEREVEINDASVWLVGVAGLAVVVAVHLREK